MMLVGIFGTGRNGSSLITRLLDGIPNAYVHPVEINFLAAFDDLASPLGRISKKTRFYAKTRDLYFIDRKVSRNKLSDYYQYQIKQVIDSFWKRLEEPFPLDTGFKLSEALKDEKYSVREFIPAFFESVTHWINSDPKFDMTIFKSIEVPYINYFQKFFPEMKFIHIIRDPLKVYESLIRSTRVENDPVLMPSWYLAGDNLGTIINKRWIPHAKSILDYKTDPNHLLVKYEDLTANPEKEITRICEWLKVDHPADPKMLTTLGGRSMARIPDNVGKKGVHTPKKVVVYTGRKFNYNDSVITSAEKNLILHTCFDYGQQLGYFSDQSKPGGFDILLQWFIPSKWEFKYSLNYYKQVRTLFAGKNSKQSNRIPFDPFKTTNGILRCVSALFVRRFYILTNILKSI